ncbi:helix-turn-helix domain-containing protein [Arthrobacter sp. HMWF013]|jgi:DNA-binding Xre family transcriptional regulator|uniref:helix-turn-helix domain-containing protein n=1 Tax=Arthrobacter sp. HMWF013 TaxID=2056849 RepID=UPI000D3D16C3|nr:helix-turn-helix transcriptional regulator [Arthrobacter sp. HMWF013]PTT67779.1 XRE family transcriptional regulator [Arthrobacter sp. HMWF013]
MKSLDYEWRLREIMATRGLFSTTKLIPLLNERGVHLSASQVYRLAAEKPERLNLQVLVALMDALDCTADELIGKVSMPTARGRATGTDQSAGSEKGLETLRERGHRPKRATILPPDNG